MRQAWMTTAASACLLLPVAGLLAGGCVDVAPSSSGPSTYTSGDTTVRYVGQPLHPEGGVLAADLTIGLVDGPEAYVFGRLADATLAPGGVIYVLDGQAQVVRAYDRAGKHLRDLGGPGRGPGEFRNARMLAAAPDGTLYVGQTYPGLLHVFSADGELLDAWTIGGTISGPITVDTAGVVHVVLRSVARQGTDWSWLQRIDTMPNEIDVITGRTMALPTGTVRLRPDGTVVDTVPEPTLPDLWGYFQHASQGRVQLGLAFLPAAWWSWSPLGHLATGVTSSYAIDLRMAPVRSQVPAESLSLGDAVFSIRARVDPIELGQDEAKVAARQWQTWTEDRRDQVWHGPTAPPPG